VRIRHCLLVCLFVTGSSDAFARGGPGGAFAALLEVSLVLAIIGGLIAGTLCARFLRRTPWKGIAFLSVVAVVVAFAFPFVGIFFGIPAIVLLAVFASVSYLVRGGLFQPRPVVPSPGSTDGTSQESETAGVSNALRWIAGTYVFWVAVALANFELLSFLAIPPVVLLFPENIGKFLPFILPPLAVALVVGVVVTAFVAKRSRANRHVAPFIFNACVLLAFFVAAEIFRYHLMSQFLRDHEPGHLESSSFLNSVLTYRTYFRMPHASFDENGKTYRWSYSERKFFQVSQGKQDQGN
jgi:hypothetical protein